MFFTFSELNYISDALLCNNGPCADLKLDTLLQQTFCMLSPECFGHLTVALFSSKLILHIHQMVLFASMHHFCFWHFLTCTFVLLAAPCNAPLLSVFRGRFYVPTVLKCTPYIFKIIVELVSSRRACKTTK